MLKFFDRNKTKEETRIREFVDNLISKYSSGSNSLQMKNYTTRAQLESRKRAISKRKLVKA